MLFAKLKENEFKLFADYIKLNTGIVYTEKKRLKLENRIKDGLKRTNLTSYMKFFDLIKINSRARTDFFNSITTNETFFFRHPEQHQFLVEKVIQEYVRETGKKNITIWSAAASDGSEIYTIAMDTIENKLKYPGVTFKYVASDLSTAILEKAKKGIYYERGVQNIPKAYLKKYFTYDAATASYAIDRKIKNLVTFKPLNLLKDMYPTGVDIVFCRNIMIYFNDDDKKRIVEKMNTNMSRGGYFFIAPTEILFDSGKFEKKKENKIYYFRKI